MQLGMIGLGRMGGNMAERCGRAGHALVVHDRDAKTVERYVEKKMTGASSVLPELLLGGHGVLQGGTVASVTRRMVWTAGTMQGGGITDIAAGATLVINEQQGAGSWTKNLGAANGGSKRDLENRGTILWYDGSVSLWGSTFTNHNLFRVLGDNDQLLGDDASLLANYGQILRKKEDIPNTALGSTDDSGWTFLAIDLDHGGTMEIHSGGIQLAQATLAGSVALAHNSELALTLPTDVQGATFTGIDSPGTGYLDDLSGIVGLYPMSVLRVLTDVAIPKIEMHAGSLVNGPATLTISAYLDWRGGEMAAEFGSPNQGRTVINEDAFLLLTKEDPKFLHGRVLNNFGRVAWSAHPAQMSVRSPAGDPNHFFENPTNEIQGFRAASTAAGDELLGTLATLRGDPTNPSPDSLLGREQQADATYTQGEDLASDYYADRFSDYERDYFDAIAAAEAAYAASSGEFEDEQVYESQLDVAEEVYYSALHQAGADYYSDERALYDAYLNDLASAKTTYLTGVAAGLRTFRGRLRDAADVAQADILAAWDGRSGNSPRSILDLVNDINRLMRGQVPDLVLPPGHAGNPSPPSVANFLSQLTADVRAALLRLRRDGR